MLNPDFKELLQCFNDAEVEYLLVGGYALAAHGVPRYTGDIDLWVRISAKNAQRILRALDTFGLGPLNLSSEDFLAENQVVQLGYPPVRIDLLTTLDGLDFDQAKTSAGFLQAEGVNIPLLSRDDLIRNKKASGRLQDLADVERLEALAKAPPPL